MAERLILTPNQDQTAAAFNPKEAVRDFYGSLYRCETSDSPDQSVVSLARRSNSAILSANGFILDLGSGRQNFGAYCRRAHGKPDGRFVSLDIAALRKRQLLAANFVDHIRGSGDHLPFDNESFSLAISNMAFDFMPRRAGEELHRVLKLDSPIFLNLHHPDLKNEDLRTTSRILAKKWRISRRRKQIKDFWQYLKESGSLFQNEEQIMNFFIGCGFEVNRVKLTSDQQDSWWEVDMVRR